MEAPVGVQVRPYIESVSRSTPRELISSECRWIGMEASLFIDSDEITTAQ